MPRSLPEWIGATADTPVPPRVRLRVLEKFHWRCDAEAHGCGRPIRSVDHWTCDHKKALIKGGENRESNLHPLCEWCDPPKTAADQAEKSYDYRVKARHAGISLRKGRPLPGGRDDRRKKTFYRGVVDRVTNQPWQGRR